MKSVFKIVIVALTLMLLAGPAFAFMPSDTGVSMPRTVWSDRGVHGTVSGKVVSSLDQTKGVEGVYVALVNAMSPGKEYLNTTTDADGNYRFTGVNATYSSAILKGPDGTGGTYQQGLNAYMIYANDSGEERYSGTFGIDTNHTNWIADPIAIYAGTPSNEDIATPEPTSVVETPAPPVETPAPPAETPTATPVPTGQFPIGLVLIGGAIVLVVLVIAAIAAYFIFKKKPRRPKKK